MGEAKRRRHAIGDAPIEQEYREKMNKLAYMIDHYWNGDVPPGERKVGFCLLVFNMGDEGRANYICNAERLDMVTLLKEQLARFEGRVSEEGHA